MQHLIIVPTRKKEILNERILNPDDLEPFDIKAEGIQVDEILAEYEEAL